MKKGKVKEFIKENKTAIIVGVATGVGCLIGYKACMHKINKQDPRILCDSLKDILDDAELVYSGKNNKNWKNNAMYTYVSETPIKPEELGELGKKMIKAGNPDKDYDFTHFIAFGKSKSK